MNEPLVSIVIPTLNSAKTVRNTMESLRNLDYNNFEIIVVDGNSTDNTLNIIDEYKSKYNIRIITEPKRGRGVAYNRGMKEANGKYVAYLDSDAQIGSKGWIRNAVNMMENDDKIAVVFTKVYSPSNSKFFQKSIDSFLCKGYTTANGAVYRKDAVIKVGGFNENMNYMQEDELLYKLQKAGYTFKVNFDDKIYHYHRDSIKGYIKQNMEAAIGAKLYYSYTKQSWIVKDSVMRISIFVLSIILLGILIYKIPIGIAALFLVFYLGLFFKVNMETCKQYKWSRYTLLSPLLIYLSIVGFSIGFLTISTNKK